MTQISEIVLEMKLAVERDCKCKACLVIPKAISILERIDEKKINQKLYEHGILMNYSEDRKRVANSIVNYLKGEEER